MRACLRASVRLEAKQEGRQQDLGIPMLSAEGAVMERLIVSVLERGISGGLAR